MIFDRIIFVGMDNTLRSPMAETIFRSLYGEEEPGFEITSRGLVGLFEEPYNQKIEMILYNHGMETVNKMANISPQKVVSSATFRDSSIASIPFA